MKKTLILMAAVVMLVAGCNKEKAMKADISGSWGVYKYLFNNIDRTNQFKTDKGNYRISFADNGTYKEFWLGPDTVLIGGTWSFIKNNEQIEMYDTLSKKRYYTLFNLTSDHVQLRNDTSQLYMEKDTVQFP